MTRTAQGGSGTAGAAAVRTEVRAQPQHRDAAELARWIAPQPPSDPSWLAVLRRDAAQRFLATGFPTVRDEQWRTTSVTAIASGRFAAQPDDLAAVAPATSGAPPALVPAPLLPSARMVFVDGRFAPRLSNLRSPEGSTFTDLRSAIGRTDPLLETHLGEIVEAAGNPFIDLNTANSRDGALVHAAPGKACALELVFAATHGGLATTPRVLVVAEEASTVAVVERHVGAHVPAASPSFTNAVTEVSVAADARVTHAKLQAEPAAAFHIATTAARVERAGVFESHVLQTGAAIGRNDVRVALAAQGAETSLNGLFLATGTQLLDHHTRVDHAAMHTMSRELYHGLLAGRSRGVFAGNVLVRPGADQTNASQTNKNLILSRGALMDSMPQLEILADDVQCSHGSTVGQLSADALFYLRSRGIPEPEARTMLAEAFARGVVDRMPEALRHHVEATVTAWLADNGGKE